MSKTPLRAVRIDDALWEAAQVKAAEQGDNLSAVIRSALRAYIQESEARNLMAQAWDEGYTMCEIDSPYEPDTPNPYR